MGTSSESISECRMDVLLVVLLELAHMLGEASVRAKGITRITPGLPPRPNRLHFAMRHERSHAAPC